MPGVGRITTPGVTEFDPPPGGRSRGAGTDAALAGLAARQHGVVALRQLEARGLTASGVRRRVARGALHRLHAGVYAVGHPVLGMHGRWMAAVLACGPGAVLSHRSAAAALELRATSRPSIDVTVPTRAGRARPGIDVHRTRLLHPDDVTIAAGIPCTSVARTLIDLAEVAGRRALEQALDQAEVLRVLDLAALEHALARSRGRPGAARLRAVIAAHEAGTTLTRSELEERFLALCAAAGVPRPEVNAWLAVDADAAPGRLLWRERRVVVETDGRGVHGTQAALVRDRRRDRRLVLAGWRVVRFSWGDVVREPGEAAATLRGLLAAA